MANSERQIQNRKCAAKKSKKQLLLIWGGSN